MHIWLRILHSVCLACMSAGLLVHLRASPTPDSKMDVFAWLSNIYRWKIYSWHVSYALRKTRLKWGGGGVYSTRSRSSGIPLGRNRDCFTGRALLGLKQGSDSLTDLPARVRPKPVRSSKSDYTLSAIKIVCNGKVIIFHFVFIKLI